MMDAATWAQVNGEYVMPLDAGPAWRAAFAYGFDMSLVEAALNQTPEQRLDEHPQELDFLLEVEAARSAHN